MTCVSAGRPLLEQRIRRRVTALPNVRLLDGTEGTGLLADAGLTRVTGISVHGPDGPGQLEADLVVDAGGRGSRLPAWLASLGFPEVQREAVNVGLGYATVYFDSFPGSDPLGKDLGVVVSAVPGSPRGAIVARMPGQFGISLIGLRGDHPPRDLGPFLDFLATLPLPEVHRAAAAAEPSGPPVSMTYPASVRHHYERVKPFPDGLIVVGDGFASFNPIYGQGMTVAAIGADLLRRHIERYAGVRPAVFLRDLAGQVAAPWALATGTDLAFPETEGTRTLMTRFANAYIPRLRRAAVADPVLSRAFLRVAGLVEAPTTLFRPAIVARTLAA
jgi:2-polyprenyl-6-methoxyphenol hydroxylase-like FAD-dependent oxidoreductase